MSRGEDRIEVPDDAPDPAAPPGFVVERTEGGAITGGYRDPGRQAPRVQLRWRSQAFSMPGAWAFLTACFGALFGANLFLGGASKGTLAGAVLFLFPLYVTIVAYLSHVTVTLADGVLRTRIGPLPWEGNAEVPAAEVAELRVAEVPQRGGRAYEVVAVTRAGERRALVKGFWDPTKARYVAEVLHRALGLPRAKTALVRAGDEGSATDEIAGEDAAQDDERRTRNA